MNTYVPPPAPAGGVTSTLLDPKAPGAIDNDEAPVQIHPKGQLVLANEKVLEPQATESVLFTSTLYVSVTDTLPVCDSGFIETLGVPRLHPTSVVVVLVVDVDVVETTKVKSLQLFPSFDSAT